MHEILSSNAPTSSCQGPVQNASGGGQRTPGCRPFWCSRAKAEAGGEAGRRADRDDQEVPKGSLSSSLPLSLSPCLPVSLSPCLPVSLSPCLPVSLSRSPSLPLSLSPWLPVSLSPSPSRSISVQGLSRISANSPQPESCSDSAVMTGPEKGNFKRATHKRLPLSRYKVTRR